MLGAGNDDGDVIRTNVFREVSYAHVTDIGDLATICRAVGIDPIGCREVNIRLRASTATIEITAERTILDTKHVASVFGHAVIQPGPERPPEVK